MSFHAVTEHRAQLGEGPFWHPLLKRIFWFDILNKIIVVRSTVKPKAS